MVKISSIKYKRHAKPFVKDEKLTLVTNEVDHKITGFTVTYGGVTKEFKVKKFNILQAWKEVEKWLKDLK